MNYWAKLIHFHSRKCIWKCLWNGGNLSRPQCVKQKAAHYIISPLSLDAEQNTLYAHIFRWKVCTKWQSVKLLWNNTVSMQMILILVQTVCEPFMTPWRSSSFRPQIIMVSLFVAPEINDCFTAVVFQFNFTYQITTLFMLIFQITDPDTQEAQSQWNHTRNSYISINKMHLKKSSEKWLSFCLGLYV